MEILHIMPALEKQPNGKDYKYPEKYVGKIFKYKDNEGEKYIYFEPNTYHAFPASAIDNLLNSKIKEIIQSTQPDENDQLTKIDTYVRKILTTSFDNVNSSIDKINEKLTDKIEAHDLENLIGSIIKEYTSDFVEIGDIQKLDECITSSDLEAELMSYATEEYVNSEITEKFENTSLEQVKKLTENLTQIISEVNDIKEEFKSEKHKNKFEEIKIDINMLTSRLADLKTSILNKEQILELVTSELELVHKNLPVLVNDLVTKRIADPKNITEKLSMGKVFALKEGGLSIEEIVKLHEKGLI